MRTHTCTHTHTHTHLLDVEVILHLYIQVLVLFHNTICLLLNRGRYLQLQWLIDMPCKTEEQCDSKPRRQHLHNSSINNLVTSVVNDLVNKLVNILNTLINSLNKNLLNNLLNNLVNSYFGFFAGEWCMPPWKWMPGHDWLFSHSARLLLQSHMHYEATPCSVTSCWFVTPTEQLQAWSGSVQSRAHCTHVEAGFFIPTSLSLSSGVHHW